MYPQTRLQRIGNRLMIDTGDIRQTVLLSGTGRSGTTWVEEVINWDNSYRIIFEPFSFRKLDILKHWESKQYLHPDNNDPRFLEPARAILSGRVKSASIDHLNHRYFARQRVVKDIRTNLLLGWIKAHFPEIPLILLLRHPCAVASSKLQLGWDCDLSELLRQKELVDDFLAPFEPEIRAARDLFDKHVFLWCIENYVPLSQFRQGEVLVVFYENLCLDPEGQIPRIMAHIRRSYTREILPKSMRPSSFARRHSAVVSGKDPVHSWKRKIARERVGRAMDILGLFRLDQLYGVEGLPLLSEEQALAYLPCGIR